MENIELRGGRYVGSAPRRKLAATIVMLLALFLLAGCGGGDEGGGGGGGGGGGNGEGGGNGGGGGQAGGGANTMQGGTTGAAAPVLTDPRLIFLAADPSALDGDRARFRGAEVRESVSERAFFIGENDAERVLVLNAGEAVQVSEGQKVRVAGTLNTSRPELEEELSLSPEELSAIEDQGIFLRARRVQPQEG